MTDPRDGRPVPVPDAYVLLRGDGVAVVLDLTSGQLPAVIHWGADLGSLSTQDVAALALTGIRTTDGNLLDVPVRQSLLPQQVAGWTGRPGLSGHRDAGAAWSPSFETTSITVDDRPVQVGVHPIVTGTTVVVVAEDRVAALGLVFEIALCAGGLLRSRVTVTEPRRGSVPPRGPGARLPGAADSRRLA